MKIWLSLSTSGGLRPGSLGYHGVTGLLYYPLLLIFCRLFPLSALLILRALGHAHFIIRNHLEPLEDAT
jgi:hypothetical protein